MEGISVVRVVCMAVAAALMLAAFVYANNASSLAPAMTGKPLVLAHRGLAQTFSREGLTNETCTASRIDPPRHAYLENTLSSMRAAFDSGADIVEFDIHPTTDGHFAVFHDWTVDCRTEGHGVTREHTLAELKALDIGYGYTADGGRTFPFRGKGIGLMPSLDEVLTTFPDKRFLINIKSNDPHEGAMLARRLADLPPTRLDLLMAYGGEPPMAALRERLPALRVMSRASLKACGLTYIALGWTGYTPAACRHTLMLVPSNYAWLLWGWPSRFLARMRRAGTEVFVTGPYAAGDPGTSGIDDAAAYRALPIGYAGGIWTNRVDLTGRLVHR
jgi:glycerophosphoryl diester phosphodiesterase